MKKGYLTALKIKMLKNFLLILLGSLIFLFFIELTLRTAGHLYYAAWMREEANKIERERLELVSIEERAKVLPEDSKLIKILCVGDSWTLGAGASPGYSYPAQLQMILDKENPNKYKVYNAGIPGCSSTKLLRYLPKFLSRYEPDMAVILIGQNDLCNPHPFELVLISNWPRRCYLYLKSAILDLRVYKVIRLGLDGLMQKIKGSKRHKADITKDIKPESNEYARIGIELSDSGKIDIARSYLEKAIDIDPANESAYLFLGHLYQSIREYDKALIEFEKLLEINPYTPFREDLYRFLFLIYQDLRIPKDDRKKIKSLIKRMPSDEIFKNPGMPFIMNLKITIKSLEHNLEKIINLISSKEAILIFQTYIELSSSNNVANNVTRILSEKHGMLLVDNEKILNRLSDLPRYFTADGHPNEKGYRIIAENVYKVIKK